MSEPAHEPDRPPTLDLTDLGPERWRGQIRPAPNPVAIRRLVWSGGAAILLLIGGISLPHPALMIGAYLLGFLLLVVTAYSVIGLVTLPLEIDLDPHRFVLGDDVLPLAEIERADATPGPLKLVVVLRDGTRHVWQISEEHHNLDDIAWLAGAIRERLPD